MAGDVNTLDMANLIGSTPPIPLTPKQETTDDTNNNDFTDDKVVQLTGNHSDVVETSSLCAERQESEGSPKALVINERSNSVETKPETQGASAPSSGKTPMTSLGEVAPLSSSGPVFPPFVPHVKTEKEKPDENAAGKSFADRFFFSAAAAAEKSGKSTKNDGGFGDEFDVIDDDDARRPTDRKVPRSLEGSAGLASVVSSQQLTIGQTKPDAGDKNRSQRMTGNQPTITSSGLSSSSSNSVVKPRCAPAREAVDPAKYFTLTDEPDGPKYACSKCGNVYKWRKSLNKHWKEKHDGEVPTLHSRPTPSFPNVHGGSGGAKSSAVMLHGAALAAATLRGGGAPAKASGLVLTPPRLPSPRKNPFTFGKFNIKDDGRDATAASKLEERLSATQLRSDRTTTTAPPLPLHGWPWFSHHQRRSPHQTYAEYMFSQNRKIPEQMRGGDGHHRTMQAVATERRSFPPQSMMIHPHHQISRGGPLDLSGTMTMMSMEPNGAADGILDLSLRGADASSRSVAHAASRFVQDEPLDFSVRSTAKTVKTASEMAPTRRWKETTTASSKAAAAAPFSDEQPTNRYEKRVQLVCARCRINCPTMSELNDHFVKRHMDVIYKAADEVAAGDRTGDGTGGGASQFYASSDTQLYRYLIEPTRRSLSCVVCGATVEWSWMLKKHFDQEHASVQPNPYRKSSSSSDVRSRTAVALRRCDVCSFATDSAAEFTRHQLKHSLTMKTTREREKERARRCDDKTTSWNDDDDDDDNAVDATEETSRLAKTSLYNNNNDDMIDLSGDDTAIVIPEAPEETSPIHGYSPASSAADRSATNYDAAPKERLHSSTVYDDANFVTVCVSGETATVVVPQAPEETSSGSSSASQTCQTPSCGGQSRSHHHQHRSGGGRKENATAAAAAGSGSAESLLPFKCERCEYRARWPSEMQQHMKNHSDEKPYQCPQCSYRSKWKWDVVKHLKRCGGGGTVRDVIDTSQRKRSYVKSLLVDSRPVTSDSNGSSVGANDASSTTPTRREVLSNGPPNVTIFPGGASCDRLDSPGRDGDDAENGDSEEADEEEEEEEEEENAAVGRTERAIGIGQNNNVHGCNQCPFVGHSPAELRRHLRVHSDEKPYACHTCSYSSKWKCDLKKHLKTYGHVSAIPLSYGGHGRKPMTWSLSSRMDNDVGTGDGDHLGGRRGGGGGEEEGSSGGGSDVGDLKSLLQGSPRAKKAFPERGGASASSRNHGNIFGGITTGGRLRCRQCEFEAIDITSFLQHKKIHKNQRTAETGGSGSGAVWERMSSSRPANHHRRKSFRQVRVPQEPTMKVDEEAPVDLVSKTVDGAAEEESAATEGRRFWESLGLRSTSSVASAPPRKRRHANDSDDGTPSKFARYASPDDRRRSPDARSDDTEFLRNCSRSQTSNSYDSDTEDTEVEYGDATVVPLVRLPVHQKPREAPAAAAPEEFGCAASAALSRSVTASSSGNNVKPDPRLKQVVVPVLRRGLRQGVTTTEAEDAAGMSKRKRKLRTCDKCGYVTDNLTTLQRHAAKHGSAGRHRCAECDYSVDRQHVLDYHVKIVHEGAGAGRQTEVKPAEKGEIVSAQLPPELMTKIDVATTPSEERPDEAVRGGPTIYDRRVVKVSRKVVCTTSMITVAGNEMEMIERGSKTWYNCVKCQFVSSNITNAVSHARQHGAANKRYRCRHCDYSLDRWSAIANHMNCQHPASSSRAVLHPFGRAATPEEVPASSSETSCGNVPTRSTGRFRLLDRFNLDPRKCVCATCGYARIDATDVALHRLAHAAADKPYSCAACAHRSTTSRLLARHAKKRHAAEKTALAPDSGVVADAEKKAFECDRRPFVGESTASVVKHLSFDRQRCSEMALGPEERGGGTHRRHRKTKTSNVSVWRWRCSLCPYVAFDERHLSIHARHHGASRKFKCGACTFSANVRNVFYKHEKLHA